jgi:hypothetical protein
MKIEYKLTEEDMLQHQLFATSQSKQIIKRRTKGKLFLLLVYMGMGIYIWNRSGVTSAGVFFILCLPLYFIYVHFEKKQYANHFRKFVRKEYQDQLDRTATIRFEKDRIEMTDGVDEGTIPFSELERIDELATFYTLSLKSSQSILLPKQTLNASSDVRTFLTGLAEQLDIPYESNLEWKWK